MVVTKLTLNGIKKVEKFHKVIIKETPVNHPIQEQMQIDQELQNQ